MTLVGKTVFYDNFVSFGCVIPNLSCQLGRVFPNIHVTLDHFPVTLVILDSVTKDHVFY